jgi:hypothetical protein
MAGSCRIILISGSIRAIFNQMSLSIAHRKAAQALNFFARQNGGSINKLSQQVLLLSVVTSQVESVKFFRRNCPETLVELTPDIFDVLKKPSIVDCNDLVQVPLADFNARYLRKEIKCFKDLPVTLRKQLRQAIHASKILTAEMKALVAKP